MISCQGDNPPVAVFHTDTLEPEVGQDVFFYNDSQGMLTDLNGILAMATFRTKSILFTGSMLPEYLKLS